MVTDRSHNARNRTAFGCHCGPSFEKSVSRSVRHLSLPTSHGWRLVYTENVGGSSPSPPTTYFDADDGPSDDLSEAALRGLLTVAHRPSAISFGSGVASSTGSSASPPRPGGRAGRGCRCPA